MPAVRAALVAALVLIAAAPAAAQGPEPLPYGTADGGGFRDILPPATRGHYDAADLVAS